MKDGFSNQCFHIFKIYRFFFCFVVAMSDLVHDVEAYFNCHQHVDISSEI